MSELYYWYNRCMDTKDLDIVYFVKDCFINEELRFSLRSVAENLPHRKVWFFGGCPRGITPDIRVKFKQNGETKWDNVHNMYKEVCENKEVTENFIMFNDDFFIMKPTDHIDTMYRSSLISHCEVIEAKNRNKPTNYTQVLRECDRELDELGASRLSYELHVPFIFNKTKLLAMLERFPEQHCTRTLYGNIYEVGGKQARDVKIFDIHPSFDYKNSRFLSTEDSIVSINNDIWRFIRSKFPKKSEFED